jgi:hypothetical protein
MASCNRSTSSARTGASHSPEGWASDQELIGHLPPARRDAYAWRFVCDGASLAELYVDPLDREIATESFRLGELGFHWCVRAR